MLLVGFPLAKIKKNLKIFTENIDHLKDFTVNYFLLHFGKWGAATEMICCDPKALVTLPYNDAHHLLKPG